MISATVPTTAIAINNEIQAAEAELKVVEAAAEAEIEAAKAALKVVEAAAEAKVKEVRDRLAKANDRKWTFDYPLELVQRMADQRLEAEGETLYLITKEARISGCSCCSHFHEQTLAEVLTDLRACLDLRGCSKLIVRVVRKDGWSIANLDEVQPVTKTRETRDRYGRKVVETYEETPQWDLESRTFPHIPGLLEWEFYDPTPAPSTP